MNEKTTIGGFINENDSKIVASEFGTEIGELLVISQAKTFLDFLVENQVFELQSTK